MFGDPSCSQANGMRCELPVIHPSSYSGFSVSHFAAKIHLDFCSACASCPIGWCCPPENVLQVQSCTALDEEPDHFIDRKSTRLNSSHQIISYAVFCLK